MKRLLFILLLSSSLAHSDIVLTDAREEGIALSALKGQWVFINYWAQWCPTCLQEIPELNQFYEQHLRAKDAVSLFAVNYDNLSLSALEQLIQQMHINYPSLYPDPKERFQLGDIVGLPATFILNPNGELVETLYGGQTAQSLNKVLAKNKK